MFIAFTFVEIFSMIGRVGRKIKIVSIISHNLGFIVFVYYEKIEKD